MVLLSVRRSVVSTIWLRFLNKMYTFLSKLRLAFIIILIPSAFFIFGIIIQHYILSYSKLVKLKKIILIIIFGWASLRLFRIISFSYNVDSFFGDISPIYGIYWLIMGVLFLIGCLVRYVIFNFFN